jgi:hypothetical protein
VERVTTASRTREAVAYTESANSPFPLPDKFRTLDWMRIKEELRMGPIFASEFV